MVQPLTREDRFEDRRRQLLAAALELFSEHGFDGTTIKEIALTTGVATGLVYHYFESKEHLLTAVIDKYGCVDEVREAVGEDFSVPASTKVLEVVEHFYEIFRERDALMRIYGREALTNDRVYDHWQRMVREAVSHLARYLAARVAKGELRTHNTEVSARTLLHTTAMFALMKEPKQRLRDLSECVISGISARRRSARGKFSKGRRKS